MHDRESSDVGCGFEISCCSSQVSWVWLPELTPLLKVRTKFQVFVTLSTFDVMSIVFTFSFGSRLKTFEWHTYIQSSSRAASTCAWHWLVCGWASVSHHCVVNETIVFDEGFEKSYISVWMVKLIFVKNVPNVISLSHHYQQNQRPQTLFCQRQTMKAIKVLASTVLLNFLNSPLFSRMNFLVHGLDRGLRNLSHLLLWTENSKDPKRTRQLYSSINHHISKRKVSPSF